MFVNILETLLLLFSISLVIVVFIFILQEKRKQNARKKESDLMKDQYEQLFLSSKSKKLFEFELIQKREDLLKKNNGPNLCENCPTIEYVEYCSDVRF